MNVITLKPAATIRLNDFLRAELPAALHRDISNSKIRRLIVAGAVQVNGSQCRNPSQTVRAGAVVSVRVDEAKLFYEKTTDDIAFDLTARDVLFEDESIIVVNKPAFFPTEAGMVASRDNLHAAVVRYLFEKQKIAHPNLKNPPYAGIMHRLDRETSGAILFTKTRAVNAACHDMFENRTVQKTYRAVVCPSDVSAFCKRKSFSVELYMGRISPKSQAAKWGALSQKDGGVYSKTDVTLIGSGVLNGKQVAFVDCLLHTGRTHQIRVHLASVDAPLLGDTLYGGLAHERIMLHAHTLTFPHPVTGEQLTVTAPLPRGFSVPRAFQPS